MRVSPAFTAHIERLEGFRARAYRDLAGVLTIGYGHAVSPTEEHFRHATLTRAEGEELLKKDVRQAEDAVNDAVRVHLRQDQFDALVSFVFNVGAGAFRQSTLLQRLNKGNCCAVPEELRKWVKVRGREVLGLVRRREAEIALYIGEGTDV